MKKFITLTIATIIFFSCSTDKKKAIEHHIKAQEFYKNDNIKNASSEIDLAIKLDSSNLDFQITKAKIIQKNDNFELAIKILKALSSKNFKLDTVNVALGACYYGYGNHFSYKQNDKEKANEYLEKALNYFNIAVNINTQYFDIYEGKFKVLHNLQRHDEALVVLNTAIKIFNDSTSLICYRGIEKMSLGDLNGAMTDLNKSIQSKKLDSTQYAIAYRFRGNVFSQKENLDSAISDLTEAIKFDPQNELIYVDRASCYEKKGLKEKACEDYRKAADLGYLIIYETIKEYCGD